MDKVFNVNICGNSFQITSEKSGDFIDRISNHVSNTLGEILTVNPKLPQHTAAILAALNIAEELYMEKEASDRIREQVTSYSSELNDYKYKMLEYKAKYEKLLEERNLK